MPLPVYTIPKSELRQAWFSYTRTGWLEDSEYPGKYVEQRERQNYFRHAFGCGWLVAKGYRLEFGPNSAIFIFE